jgi:hypothetical protein
MNKNKGFIGIGLIIAIVLGIAVVGGGAYYLGKSGNKPVVINPENSLPNVENQNLPVVENKSTNISSLVAVISPNGGEIYKDSDKIAIKWKDVNINKDRIAIYLRFSSGEWCFIKDIPSSNTNYTFTPYGHDCGDGRGSISGIQKYKITLIAYDNGGMAPEPGTAFAGDYSDNDDSDIGYSIDSSDNYFTINSATISSNLIKQTDCGVSFSKTSEWSVVSNTSNEIKLDIPDDTHTGFAGIDIKCVLGNSITDTDAKFGNITYYYDSSSQKWMVSKPNERDGGTLPAVVATPEFTVNGLSVFRGTGRWLTYIIPTSSSSILSLREGDTEGGLTQSLTNLVKTLKKL